MEKENKKTIEIPFGAKDSELNKFEYTIPEGYEARIDGNKVIIEQKVGKDEMIRQSLVEYFRKFNPKNMWDGTFSFGDVLSYLERQKDKVVKFDHDREQKPAKEDGPFDEDKFLEGELAAFLQNYDKEYDDDAAISDVAIHFYELGKKMKQKPAEWSEEDEKMLFFLNEFMDNKGKDYFTTLVYPKIKIWLKSLHERFNLEPKQKWSEEDEKMLNGIIERGNSEIPKGECGLTPNQVAWLETRLKSIRPQPEQGWSEEEKKHLYNAIEAVKYVYDISEGTSGFKCVEFLKSLRPQPHWKPSKKQIDALNSIILIGSFTYVGQTQDLISLKDDLKKLM